MASKKKSKIKKMSNKAALESKKMKQDAMKAWKQVRSKLRQAEGKAEKYIEKHPARAAAIIAAAGVAAGMGLKALRRKSK